MIPTHWTPYRRVDDGEVVGYLAPGEGDMHVPTSLLGHPLGVAMEREDATELLERTGLALLADKWRLDREGARPARRGGPGVAGRGGGAVGGLR